MKHIKLFEDAIQKINENVMMQLPEGYQFSLFNPNDEVDCRRHFDEDDTESWSGMSFEERMNGLDQMGEMAYPDGNTYLRGEIKWEPMGLNYIYEIHPL